LHKQLSIDFDAAYQARERGIERSRAHADACESGWTYQAVALITAFAKANAGRTFLIEEARAYAIENGLPHPPDARAWGGATRSARAKGRIKKVGAAQAASSNLSLKHTWEYCNEK